MHHAGQAAFKKLIESGEYQAVWDRNQAYYESKWGTVDAARASRDVTRRSRGHFLRASHSDRPQLMLDSIGRQRSMCQTTPRSVTWDWYHTFSRWT